MPTNLLKGREGKMRLMWYGYRNRGRLEVSLITDHELDVKLVSRCTAVHEVGTI